MVALRTAPAGNRTFSYLRLPAHDAALNDDLRAQVFASRFRENFMNHTRFAPHCS
jgi:hypothetical protein